MSIGLSQGKADIDAQLAQAAIQLREALLVIQRLQAFLAATPDATLVTAGYTAEEVATIKSASSDMDKLRTIFEGTATQASAYDFRTFVKLLTGPR